MTDQVAEVTINSQDSLQAANDKDILQILVATDIHLGYNEKDPYNRGEDSFLAFEEILQNAVAHDVDFILLGGDLFHDSKPSPECLHRCISLLRRYCLGDKPVAIEFMSDQSISFKHMLNSVVNYEDPNLNVSIPVFSIHGNHDDPTGAKQLSALDIMADTGLLNYFGKWTDLTKVDIYPLLIKKGITNLALYGLSHIKDERLSRLFKEKKVAMPRPSESNDWFNLLVLHQNHAQNRGIKNFIPETVIPDFINLVIWGHEHDCYIDPILSLNGSTFISQPGSSVATSLAAGESITKHVGILQVYKTGFKMHKIKLKTVRPFVFKDAIMPLPEIPLNMKLNEYAQQQVSVLIEEMLEEAKAQINEDEPRQPKIPILRLIVIFSDESMIFNAIRMGQLYADRVANPVDMLSFKTKKTTRKTGPKETEVDEDLEDQSVQRVEQLIENYFEIKDTHLKVLTVKGLSEAVSRYIDKNDTDSLEDIYKHQYKKSMDQLLREEGEINVFRLDELLEQYRQQRQQNAPDMELEEVARVLDDPNRSLCRSKEDNLSSDDEMSSKALSTSTSTLGSVRPARGRGRGSRGPRRPRTRTPR